MYFHHGKKLQTKKLHQNKDRFSEINVTISECLLFNFIKLIQESHDNLLIISKL